MEDGFAKIVLSAGCEMKVAVAIWCTWLIGFTATTVAVRGVVAAQKRKPRLVHFAWMLALTVSVELAFASMGPWLLMSLPMLGASWFLLLAPQHDRFYLNTLATVWNTREI